MNPFDDKKAGWHTFWGCTSMAIFGEKVKNINWILENGKKFIWIILLFNKNNL
jgi:hypothetical protein